MSDNVVLGIAPGRTAVTVKDRITGVSAVYTVIVTKPLSETEVTLSRDEYDYTGREVKAEVTVTDHGVLLKEGVDYLLSYEDNIGPGTARVMIEGIGAYAGSVTESFRIVKHGDDEKKEEGKDSSGPPVPSAWTLAKTAAVNTGDTLNAGERLLQFSGSLILAAVSLLVLRKYS